MGKSYLCEHQIKSNPRRVIIDPRREHDADFQFFTLYDFTQFFNAETVPIGLTVSYSPMEDQTQDEHLMFEFLTKLNGYSIFIDELDQFCTASQLPKWLKYLVNFQRHYHIDLLFAARRPADIHRTFTALADEIYFFHMHETRDLLYVANLCGKPFAEGVKQLQPKHFMRQAFPDTKPSMGRPYMP